MIEQPKEDLLRALNSFYDLAIKFTTKKVSLTEFCNMFEIVEEKLKNYNPKLYDWLMSKESIKMDVWIKMTIDYVKKDKIPD